MVNLKKEMEILLRHTYDLFVVRHIGQTKCNCWRAPANVPDPECPNCEGMGWLWEEFLVKGKLFWIPAMVAHGQDFTYGMSYSNLVTIYFKTDELSLDNLRISDRIFLVRADEYGEVLEPIQRTRKWQVTDVYDFHEQDNKFEFFKVYAKPEVV
jgi:hypothetical protein